MSSYFNLDDMIKNLYGKDSGNIAHYTEEEIAAAKKRQKKVGGTIMDNLIAVHNENTPKKTSSPNPIDASLKTYQDVTQKMFDSINAYKERSTKVQDSIDAVEKVTAMNAEEISKSIREMNSQIEMDFGSKSTNFGEEKPQPVLTDNGEILAQFNGLSDSLKETIFGQDDFIKKLVIAFKRPYVSERDKNDALNSVFLTGPAKTGKHFALSAMANELSKRRIIKSATIQSIDLSIYPNASEEKLFLQDLYSALQSDSSIIVFENMESCHISLLTRLNDLVATGECKLSERYVMQNGQLINVSNAFASNATASFEAKGKYLIFISNKSVEKLADVMGAPFINALGDICTTASLDEEALQKIAEEQEKQLLEKCKKQLAYDITLDDSYKAYILEQTSRGRALKGILDTLRDTLRALTELRLERDDLSTGALTLTVKENAPYILVGEEEIPMGTLLPDGYKGELNAVKAEMDSIVGLKEVKEYIYGLEEYFDVQKRRRESGLKAGELNKHMIFTGNPGTGKTTIARIVSKYLKAIGVLSGGQLVEVSRADLVGRYVGHTAPLVNQVIKSALGGVLFIDEAYSLYRGKDDNFGLEAIDTLVKGIEDNRDNLIVILAGYSKEMSEFLESNSGLKSRFPNIIDFPDYTAEELLAIGNLTAKSKGYVIDESAKQPLLDYFAHVQATRAKDAGNGRLVRNKLEAAILNQSRRLVAEPDADMTLLLEQDFDLND